MIGLLAQVEWDWTQWAVPFSAQWWQETACSVLVGIACGVLGCFVVLRRMALIGDALSHAVLPGVVIAFLITKSTGIGGLLLGALLAGLVTAGLIKLVSQYSRTKEDSAIGIVFTAFFAVGIILISGMGRGTHFDLKCFLFGDPLAVGRDDLIMMSIVAPTVLIIVFALYHRLKLTSFDPIVASAMGISVAALHYLLMAMLSATVVAGLKTTGVVLVVAMVITPASAAYQICNRLWSMLLLAGLFGALAAAGGMSVAFVTNCPTGPAMVLVATLLFAVTMVLSPNQGLFIKALQKHRIRRHIDAEDILKAFFHATQAGTPRATGSLRAVPDRIAVTPAPVGGPPPSEVGEPMISAVDTLHASENAAGPARPTTLLKDLSERIGISPARLKSGLRQLERLGQLRQTAGTIELTPTGRARAKQLVRAHRLWETYLADEAGVDMEVIHDEAERLEHVHELADEVDATLGHPKHDPHGTLIP